MQLNQLESELFDWKMFNEKTFDGVAGQLINGNRVRNSHISSIKKHLKIHVVLQQIMPLLSVALWPLWGPITGV
jgi:hypothetical protein